MLHADEILRSGIRQGFRLVQRILLHSKVLATFATLNLAAFELIVAAFALWPAACRPPNLHVNREIA